MNVFVQPENDSFDAIATEFFSSPFGQNLEEQLSASLVEFHVTELVQQK